MKNYISRLLFFFISLIMATACAAQDITMENPFVPGTDAGKVFTWFTAVYGSINIALTYIVSVFFKKTSLGRFSPAVKYLVIAITTGALFMSLGWANALQIFIGFIGAAVTYDKALKPLGLATPK